MTFRQWLNVHTRNLRTYQSNEIVNLAVACGFDFREVCRELWIWYMELAQDGFQQTDLMETWSMLRMYEDTGFLFDWPEGEPMILEMEVA